MNSSYLAESPPILREYLGYMETVKGRSANTVNGYFIDLRLFFRFLLKQKHICHTADDDSLNISLIDISLLQSVTLADLFEFMNYLKNDLKNSNVTRARKVSSIKQFFHYLTEVTHKLDENPAKNLSSPKLPARMPKHLTYDQSIQLLQVAGQGKFAERDYCIITLLLNCGLRRAEIAGLNRTDVRDDNTMRVIGKGNKERILYLNEACQNAIKAYLPKRPIDGTKDKNALFYGHTKDRISLQGIHYIVKGYLKQVTGAEEFSTHKLRHTAATLMYQQGGVDLLVLKEMLGHKNLGTTEIYTHTSNEQLRRAADANPLSKVNNSPIPKNTNKKGTE